MKLIKRLLLGAGALFVVLMVIGAMTTGSSTTIPGSSAPQASAEPVAQTTPDLQVSAVDLHEAYDANEIAADTRFKGKKILVTGTVESIDKNAFDQPYLSLASGNDFTAVHAELEDGSVQKAATLAKGLEVTLSCTGSGRLMGAAMLSDCTLR